MSDVNLLADIVQTLYFRLRYQPIFIIIFIGGKNSYNSYRIITELRSIDVMEHFYYKVMVI